MSFRALADRLISRSRPSSPWPSSTISPADEPVRHHHRRQSMGAVPSRFIERTLSTRSERRPSEPTRRHSMMGPERRSSGLWVDRRLSHWKTPLRDEKWNRRRALCPETPEAYFSRVPGSHDKLNSPTSSVELEPLSFSPVPFVITLSDAISSESWLSLSDHSPMDSCPDPLPAPKPIRPTSVPILSPSCWLSFPPDMQEHESEDEAEDAEDWLSEEFIPAESSAPHILTEDAGDTLDWREFHDKWLEKSTSYPTTPCEL